MKPSRQSHPTGLSDRIRRGLSLALASGGVLLCAGMAGCFGGGSKGPKPDPGLVSALESATKAYSKGDLSGAESAYRAALSRARAMDDAQATGDAAYNLALCLSRKGEFDPAKAFLAESRRAYTRTAGLPDDVMVLESRIALRRGKTARARELATAVLNRQRRSGAAGTLKANLLLAEVALEEGNAGEAATHLTAAGRAPKDVWKDGLRARHEHALARVAAASDQWADSADHREKEAVEWRSAKRYAQMATALGRAGDARMQAGEPSAAFDLYYRAAAAFHGQGDILQAVDVYGKSLEAAERAGMRELPAEAGNLFREIQASLEESED